MNLERDFNNLEPGEIFNPDEEISEHLKWVCDGAETLSEAAEELREYAEYLVSLEKAGWQLAGPVDSGHLYILNDSITN